MVACKDFWVYRCIIRSRIGEQKENSRTCPTAMRRITQQWVGSLGVTNLKTFRNQQGRTARNAGKLETPTLIASTEPMSSSPVTKAAHASRKSNFTKTTAQKVGSHISTSDESSPMRKKIGLARRRPRLTTPRNDSLRLTPG